MNVEEVISELWSRMDASKRIDAESDKMTAKIYGDVSPFHRHLKHVPRIECADGFKMSVQASSFHYCSPRDSEGPWDAVEVGFPSEEVEGFMPYIDGEDSKPTDTVYGYVPITVVARAIIDHGGFAASKAGG